MKNQLIAAAILAALTGSATFAQDAKMSDTEKCYGIAKAGKNDCAAKDGKNACAGQAEKNGGWIYVPKDLCEKITGGVKG